MTIQKLPRRFRSFALLTVLAAALSLLAITANAGSYAKKPNKDKLTAIPTYHVVAGKVTSAQVVKLDSATTVNGQDVSIRIDEVILPN